MPNYDKKELEKLLQKHRLEFIALFGSAAKERLGKISDIDIAVKSPKPISLEEYTELTHKLSQIFNTTFQKIDLAVIEKTSPPLLLWQIAKKGILLTGDQSNFKKFRLYALRKYFDTKKFRDLTERHIKQYLYAR